MAVYAVTGKLGTGKTKFSVWRAQSALKAGRRVASNVDLHLDVLAGPRAVAKSYVRIPDKPTAFDLEALGHGNPESYDEDRNGVMILDELGTWLNSRSFQDKGRAGLLDWLIHARKLGWDVYLVVQDAAMIDKQVRTALIEYEARCLRLDKVKLPLIGGWINDIAGVFRPGGDGGRWGYLPRMHLVAARVGEGSNAVVAERWWYLGDWLHKAYDTRQVFRSDYEHGAFSQLHPGKFVNQAEARAWWHRFMSARPARPPLKPKLPQVQDLARLPPDDAWRAARVLAKA